MINVEHLVGSVLSGRYQILDKIGSGGMAIVYKAHDNVLNRDVAIKILRESYESESSVVSNFIREAQASAKLVHTNVVSVYDVIEFDGINYMVMELVNGITLKEYIKENPRMPWQEACDYAIQIGQGISAAHEHGIIHRDIKPQNIIMSPGGVLKVTDFGIAKAMENEKSMAGGTAMGSVHYISPEQARGGYTDFRSDIYSLGIVLYEMLAGRVPFDGDSPMSVALMHIEEDPVSVKCVNIDVPADLDYVTMKAMNREPDKRYQSMKELLEDLRAVLADEILPSREGQEMSDQAQRSAVTADDDDETQDANGKSRSVRVKTKVKDEIKKKKAERNAIILAISTVAALILVGIGLLMFFVHPTSRTVPDLVGLTIEEAEQKAKNCGYTVDDDKEYVVSDTVEVDHVISQSPEAGEEGSRKDPIKIVVSLGASGGNIEMPNVVQMKVEEAVSAVEAVSLTYQVVGVYADEAEGTVVRQTPEAGTKLNAGDYVTLYYSLGEDGGYSMESKVKVPSVIGMTLDGAKRVITTAGLHVGQISNIASASPAGTVVSQGRPAGEEAKSGDLVSLVISSGPAEVHVSNDASSAQGQTNTAAPVTSGDSTTASNTGTSTSHMYTVRIPGEAKNDKVSIQIVANGATVHNATHSKSEGQVTVEIPYSGDVRIQVYVDGSKTVDKTVTF